jgi:hypothetical protein
VLAPDERASAISGASKWLVWRLETPVQFVTECDQQLQKQLASFAGTIPLPPSEAEPKRKRIKPAKNAPRFELRSELQRITGVDLRRIDGIDVMVAQPS